MRLTDLRSFCNILLLQIAVIRYASSVAGAD